MSMEISTNAKDRSLKQVLSDARTDASLLVRQEIALAKAELKEKAIGVAKQGALFGAAGLFAYAGLLVLISALILGVVALGMAAWLAALMVGALVLFAAFMLVQRARRAKAPRA